MKNKCQIGVIGGSGLYHMEGLNKVEEMEIETPFGSPSDKLRVGELSGRPVAFLPRHGRDHSLLPSEIPYRANIYAMKSLGVEWIISLSAVGSLKEEYKPRDFVFPLQFFDRTKNPIHTFFGQGIAAHVSFGKPICERLATILFQSATAAGAITHWGGTYVNMEGPAFSTLAESQFHRKQGFDVIGMTNLAEAKLAREAEISYAPIAMVTDYDCWHTQESEVNVSEIVQVLSDNAELAKKTVTHVVAQIPLGEKTESHSALKYAIITPKEKWPQERVKALEAILEPYLEVENK